MKILVMGAGAVGAYFGARLRASGEDVVLCARGENLRAIREHGLDITSIRGDLRIDVAATDTPSDFAPYDLILFCVKAYHTDAAAQAISGCLKPGGAILTLQNGVENEAKLAAIFGRDAYVPRALYPMILPHVLATGAVAPFVFRLAQRLHVATVLSTRVREAE